MARKREPIWDHFTDAPKGEYKTSRVQCTHCGGTTSASVKNMITHISNCPSVPTSVGRLAESLNDTRGRISSSTLILDSLNAKIYPTLSRPEKAVIDQAFAAAVHKTGTEFALFEHPAWVDFFDLLLGKQWSPPLSGTLSTSLLADCYQSEMMNMRSAIRSAPAITVGVDGATNVLSKSISNVIAHDPRPWFVEYLPSNLKKESCHVVTEKIADTLKKLNGFAQRDVVFAFVSDSCNLMRSVRRTLVEKKVVAFAYGCSAHALNNLCEDISKLPSMKVSVREGVFVSKTIKNKTLLGKIFADLCEEMHGKSYSMVLYSASRWSSVNLMFQRLEKVKRAITALHAAVLNEKEDRAIDESFELPSDFKNIITDGGFWRRVREAGTIFDPICKCIGVLESNSATMSTVYACFLHVHVHIQRTFPSEQSAHLNKQLLYRWNRIRSSVHALAFYCDPFYRPFRMALMTEYTVDVIGMGHGDLCSQSRAALGEICCRKVGHSVEIDAVLLEFMQFCLEEETFLEMWCGQELFQPRMLWSQAKEKFPLLSQILIKVYSAPASTAGVERQHKIAKRIHSAARNRMSSGKVEEQVAVAHNAAVNTIVLNPKRQKFEVFMVENAIVRTAQASTEAVHAEGATAETAAATTGEENVADYVEGELAALTDSELAEQEALSAALALTDLNSITDDSLFPEHEV